MRSGNSESAPLNSKRMPRVPTGVMRATLSQELEYLGRPFSARVSIDQITSSTVTGLPSENFAPSRRVNSTEERSGATSIDSASRP